jgi:prophage tail gpP-like protein
MTTEHAHISRQVTQAQSHFLFKRCVVGLVEDDSVRVDMDATRVNACALGLDECDAMLHRCAVFLLDAKEMDVTTVVLVESEVVEVEHAF